MPIPNIIINNVDETFFTRNAITPEDVKVLLSKLPVPGYVNRIVLDGETTGEQKGPIKTTKHPMLYALNNEDRKVAVFLSSTGRATRNIGAKRVLQAIMEDNSKSVMMVATSDR
jgi:hypothetical protein|tara:strand:- start:256 stop:597 length:342 start_codon:yes stop_codon:yes gene_type:complete